MSAASASQATTLSDAALLDIAIDAASAGAELVRARTADISGLLWTEKNPADFVTEVDREAEAAIDAVIRRSAPGARTVGEELTPQIGSLSGIVFVVDPIDGTTNFLHRYPEYAVSVGVARDGDLVAGVIMNIPTGETFTAARGQGARRNSEIIHVSDISVPGRALIGTGFPFKHPQYLPRYLRQMERIIQKTAGVRRAGSAALDLADVACGRFDAFWELMLAPWDVAAGILIVREAGGVVTDLNGVNSGLAHAAVVAGNPVVHDWLLSILSGEHLSDVNAVPRATL